MNNVESARTFLSPVAAVRPGTVTLAGAGPGDPDLLTLKAARALAGARLVLYDNLVSQPVLQLAPPEAELIYVGKAHSRHSMRQEDITQLLVRLARSGRDVLRLKGGDPYIFGRGGEEAQALAEAGIPFTVIPGISAAQGAAAYAGIPLTHRDHAARMQWVTGHLREGAHPGASDALELDWPALAQPRQTLVIYMGLNSLPVLSARLIEHGLDPCTPAALIERATLPEQRQVVGTLATLPELARVHAITSPALVIVGSVVTLQAVLQPGTALGLEPLPPARAAA